MIGWVRAATICAMLVVGLVSADAAEKAFRRDDLADSAVKLEAQIKSEAGPVAKSAPALRTDADAAFKRSDLRSGLQILGQISGPVDWSKMVDGSFLPTDLQASR